MRLAGVVKAFGQARALDAADLALTGGLVGLIGANGSGKSTLLRVLAGVTGWDAGTVEVFGLHPRRDRSALRGRTAYVGQDAALDPEMTGWETLRLFHALQGLPRAQRDGCLAFVAERSGIGGFADRPVATWSGGERQRLHLALATMHDPRLLMLDEPTTSLDPEGRRDLWRQLSEWRDADPGRTALVATHDLADVAAHCDHVVLLHRGRVLAADTPAALVAAHARARTVVTLAREAGTEEMLGPLLARTPGVHEVTVRGDTVVLWRGESPETPDPVLGVLASADHAVRAYQHHEPDLSGAYFGLTGGAPGIAAAPANGGGRGRGGGGGGGGRGMGGGGGRGRGG